MEIYIHIGLPRTGTTFLQKKVFGVIDSKTDSGGRFIYNPSNIVDALLVAIEHHENGREDLFLEDKNRIHSTINGYSAKDTLLLSSEGFSVDPWHQHRPKNHILFKKIFPEAKILLVLRYQPDWVLSIYKLSFLKGWCVTLDHFTNYKNERFIPFIRYSDSRRKATINLDGIKFAELVDSYVTSFGRNNVDIYFFEHFRADPEGFVSTLMKSMKVNCGRILETIDFHERVNDGMLSRDIIWFTKIVTLNGWMHDLQFISSRTTIKRHLLFPLVIGSRLQQAIRNALLPIFYACSRNFPESKDNLKSGIVYQKLEKHFQQENLGLLRHLDSQYIPDKYLE